MRHPFTWSETLLVAVDRPVPAAEVLDRVERALKLQSAGPIQRTETGLSFRVGLGPSLRGWSPLYGISAGTVDVRMDSANMEVRYRLGFGRIAAIATAMVGFVALQLFLADEPSPVPPSTLLAGWAMLVGASMGVALARFPGFLRKTAASAAQGEAASRVVRFGG